MEKWTLNSVWYNFLKVMEKAGTTATRGYVKQLINSICDGAGVSRESLGIYAGARASLYFQGDWISVSFDAIGGLAEKWTYILFIEKEGIPLPVQITPAPGPGNVVITLNARSYIPTVIDSQGNVKHFPPPNANYSMIGSEK